MSALADVGSMLDHALQYQREGRHIFPVCSPAMGAHRHAEGPCKQPGKRPMVPWELYQQRIPTETEVKTWWLKWPQANIGEATGAAAGYVVLDVDGADARAACLALGGLDETPTVWTGKPGAAHYHLQHPGGEVRNFARKLPGTDFRGDGGYVLLPPSLHAGGARYRWAEGAEAPAPKAMPGWLRDALSGRGSHREGNQEPLDLTAILSGVPEGERDDTLYRFACKMRRDGVPQRYAELTIRQAARACRPAFDEDLAADKVTRAYRLFAPHDLTIGASEATDSPPVWQPGILLSEEEKRSAARNTFVDDYCAYAAKRTDAPRSFHEAIALAILSAVVGRRAVLRLAVGDVYPSIWILILADSTRFRKSTAMDIGRELIESLGHDLLAPNDFTPQRFVAIMAEHDGQPLLFVRDEFSGFYDGLNRLEYMAGLKEALCNFYDGRPFKREKMKPKDSEDKPAKEGEWRFNIREPFLSVAVATTEERFFEVARVNDVHSGFLPRFAFILPPKHPGERLPLRGMDYLLGNQQLHLANRLKQIATSDATLFCEPETLGRLDRYVADLEAEASAAPDRNIVGIVGDRISWVAMRIAMLLAVADRTRRVGLPHLLRGVEIAENWRHAALKILGSLAPSKFEKRAARLVRLVDQKGRLSRREAMRALKLSRREMDDLQATLAERGEIRTSVSRTSGPETVWFETAGLSPLSPLSPRPFSEKEPAGAGNGLGDSSDIGDSVLPAVANAGVQPIDAESRTARPGVCRRCGKPAAPNLLFTCVSCADELRRQAVAAQGN